MLYRHCGSFFLIFGRKEGPATTTPWVFFHRLDHHEAASKRNVIIGHTPPPAHQKPQVTQQKGTSSSSQPLLPLDLSRKAAVFRRLGEKLPSTEPKPGPTTTQEEDDEVLLIEIDLSDFE